MRALSAFHCSWELTGNDLQTSQQHESTEHMGMNIHSTNQINFNHGTLCQTVGQTSVDMDKVKSLGKSFKISLQDVEKTQSPGMKFIK